MIERVCEEVWKVKADSNVYVLTRRFLVIDTGNRANRAVLEQFLSKIVPLDQIKKVVFTHLHFDHIGNFDLFENAEFYASEEEIEDWNKDEEGTILNKNMAEKFRSAKLTPLMETIEGLEVVKTPGHTSGSVCLWEPAERILFSGDTLLSKGPGRTDLPTSASKELHQSLIKLVGYNYRILCPGHDY